MGHTFPSAEWTTAFQDAINANDAYRTAGAGWTQGAVALAVHPEPELGLSSQACMILDVHSGTCRNATFHASGTDLSDVPFVIVASYQRWKEVIDGSLDPIKGMMEGKLKLTQGNLPAIIRFVEASRELVRSAANVPTDFLEPRFQS